MNNSDFLTKVVPTFSIKDSIKSYDEDSKKGKDVDLEKKKGGKR